MNNNAPEIFAVDAGLLQQIADYLQTRPYREVAGMLNGLSQAQPLKVTKAPEIPSEGNDDAEE